MTSWKCGTRRPFTLRLTPKKPRSATWCCPHELKQPLHLMCRSRAAGSSLSSTSVRRLRSSPASPRELEMPSLQVSVPGQAVTVAVAKHQASLTLSGPLTGTAGKQLAFSGALDTGGNGVPPNASLTVLRTTPLSTLRSVRVTPGSAPP